MTPERIAYARERITRLTNKIRSADIVISKFSQNESLTSLIANELKQIKHQRSNNIAARKRWLKELKEAGVIS